MRSYLYNLLLRNASTQPKRGKTGKHYVQLAVCYLLIMEEYAEKQTKQKSDQRTTDGKKDDVFEWDGKELFLPKNLHHRKAIR